MTAKRILTTLLCATLLLGPAQTMFAAESTAGGATPVKPVATLLAEEELQELAALEATLPPETDVTGGQWAETSAWAWGITIVFGVAIAYTLAIHGPP